MRWARRAWGSALSLSFVSLGLACNLIIGAHERSVEAGDAAPRADRAAPSDREPPAVDGGAPTPEAGGEDPPDAGDDAGKGPLVAGPAWTSPNNAGFRVSDAGVEITAFDPAASHPVVVPTPQPPIPAEDYTVVGTVRAGTEGEFGILARVQPNGAAVILSTRFGGQYFPWIGNFGPPNWNPEKDGQGAPYTFVSGTRYRFKLKVSGDQASGKLWDANLTEPEAPSVLAVIPWKTGRGVGFYTYGVLSGTILESLVVTVP